MERRTQKIILFFTFVVLFLIAAPIVALYSQGYRFDFEEKRFAKTGSIFLKATPKRAEVIIDEKATTETDLFFGSALVEQLLPGQYNVQLQKDGFQSWSKFLTVDAQLVTEAKNIILFQELIPFRELAADAIDVVFADNQDIAIFFEEQEVTRALGTVEDTKNPEEESTEEDTDTEPLARTETITVQSLKLYDLERNVKSHLISTDEFPEDGVTLRDVTVSANGRTVLIEAVVAEALAYYVLELPPRQKLTKIDNIPLAALDIAFHPTDENLLLVTLPPLQERAAHTSLWTFSTESDSLSGTPVVAEFLAYEATDTHLLWLNTSGHLMQQRWGSANTDQLTQDPLSEATGDVFYTIVNTDTAIVIQQGDTLFALDPTDDTFHSVAGNIQHVAFSPDQQKMAFASGHELSLYYFTAHTTQPHREPGETVFILRLTDTIVDFTWLNDHYLAFSTPTETRIVETDTRDTAQTWSASNVGDAQLFFDLDTRQLYTFAKNVLRLSDPLF